MANTALSMSKIRQILRLYSQGRSKLSIAAQTGVSRNTAKKYLTAFDTGVFSFEEINALDDKELEDFFGKSNERAPDKRQLALQRCFPQVDKELKRAGMNRRILWEAYIKEFPDGFKYTQFCFLYNGWKARVNPVMHLDHKAGDKMYVDFAGEKLSITDKDSGELIEVDCLLPYWVRAN